MAKEYVGGYQLADMREAIARVKAFLPKLEIIVSFADEVDGVQMVQYFIEKQNEGEAPPDEHSGTHHPTEVGDFLATAIEDVLGELIDPIRSAGVT